MFEYIRIADKPVVEGMEAEEVIYAANQPQYLPLRTLVSADPQCSVFSRWSPSESQRKAIMEGADIYLELLTFMEPLQPIRMMVSDGKLDNDWVRVCLLQGRARQQIPDDVVVRPDGTREPIKAEAQ